MVMKLVMTRLQSWLQSKFHVFAFGQYHGYFLLTTEVKVFHFKGHLKKGEHKM